MLSPVVEKRINEISTISDELSYILPRDGWTDYSIGLLARLQKLAIVLDDEDERADGMMDAFKNAWITTENNHKIHIGDDGNPDKGNPNVLAAIEGAIKKKDDDEKKGTGKVKKVGDNVGEKYKSAYPIEQISATGENKPCKSFAPGMLKYHKDVCHKGQYDNMTDEQYEEHARNLLKKKCGKDVLGYRCSDGGVCRFNYLTGEYAKGYPGGNIKTCFYPTIMNPDGTKTFDLEYARSYFRKRKRVESFDD